MTKQEKAKLAAALARSSEELALQDAINAGKSGGCTADGTLEADLSTPTASSQDGPRMTSNFGGKKAAPFGSKERKLGRKRLAAKRLKAKNVALAASGTSDIELGKDGSKWKHGYIPLNPAAVALKAHKKPGGHGSSTGRSSSTAAKNVAGMSNTSLQNIQHNSSWNDAHREAARAELQRRGVTPAPHPSSSPDRHNNTPDLTGALNAQREKEAERERAKKSSRPKASALLSHEEIQTLAKRKAQLSNANAIDKRAVRNSNLDAGTHPAEAHIKERNRELGQINRRLAAHVAERDARQRAEPPSVTPMSANTVYKLTGKTPAELKKELARQTALGKKTHKANVERQKAEAAVVAKSPLKRHIERAPGLGEPQSIRKAAMLHAAGNHSAALDELEQQKAFTARAGLDTRNLSSAIRTLKAENAKKAAENPFDRSKVQPRTSVSPAVDAARTARLNKREAAQARADRDYEPAKASGTVGNYTNPGDTVKKGHYADTSPSAARHLQQFKVGDKVVVTSRESGTSHVATVNRSSRGDGGGFGSAESHTVGASLGPGRYTYDVTNGRLTTGKLNIRHATASEIESGVANEARQTAAKEVGTAGSARINVGGGKSVAVGDYVSLKGQSHSKVKVVDYNRTTQKFQVESRFGDKQWIDRMKVTPYGSDTGPESPIGGRPVKGTGVPYQLRH